MGVNHPRLIFIALLIPVILFGALCTQPCSADGGQLQVTVTASPSSVSAGSPAQILVTVMYYGQPMSGATVVVTTTSGSATLTPSSGKTDSSGRASFRLDTTTSTSGTVRVSVSVTKVSIDFGTITGNGYADVPVQPMVLVPLEPGMIIITTTTPVPQPYQPLAPQPQPYQPPYQPPEPVPQPGSDQPPVAVISADKYAGDVPLTVTFDGRQSYAPGGSIVTYMWNFGDGSSGAGYIADHTYTKVGTFTVSLFVTDNNERTSVPATYLISAQSAVQASVYSASMPCDDGNKCTVNDYYDASGKCVAGQLLNCNENSPNGTNSCNPATGCLHQQAAEPTVVPPPVPGSSLWNGFFTLFSPSLSPQTTPGSEDEKTYETMRKPTETAGLNEGGFAGFLNFPSQIFQGLQGILIPGAPSATSPGSHAPAEKSDENVFSCVDTGGTKCPAGCRYLKTDPKNCGSCGNSCPPIAYSEPVCINGECSFSCLQHDADCNKFAFDGCEVNLPTDPKNCGRCGNSCPADRICRNGECLCPDDLYECNGKCGDLNNDAKNCGLCGKTCDINQLCCGGTCINTMSDDSNCGTCGNKCSWPDTCLNGICEHGGCFIADTPVATYNSSRPISMVRTGDVVSSYDLSMNRVINRTITEISIHKNQSVLRLEFENDTIVCTPIQPFFTGTWIPASQLKAGDKVLCRDNHWETLIKDPTPAGESDVYNLHGSPSEAYYASYYVGKSQLLVHNMKKAG
jgi:PKD repeat protein